LPGIRRRLRSDLREANVIYLTALIVALLFVYLGVALVRPEWF
jgi:F subunit of K+-transporting ATPase (Potass_KdpF)